MACRVSLDSLEDGRIAVVKVATDPPSSTLRREAEWLTEARHRGVVDLLSISDDPPTIRTLRAGSVTLRTGNTTPSEAAVLLTDLAVTLADLHERSLVHGAICLDHVVVDGERVRLCSPTGTATDHTKDLKGLGDIVRQLMKRWDETGIALPFTDEWTRVAVRLEADGTDYSARRSAREFAKLSAKLSKPLQSAATSQAELHSPTTPSATASRARQARGLTIGATLCVIAFAGLLGAQGLQADAAGDHETYSDVLEVVVGPARYILPTSPTQDGHLVALETVCPGNSGVVFLDRTTDQLWIFKTPESDPELLATVPGAFTASPSQACESVIVLGPAGRAEVRLK